MTTTPGHVTSSLSPWQPPVAWIPRPPPVVDYSATSVRLLSSLVLRFDFRAMIFLPQVVSLPAGLEAPPPWLDTGAAFELAQRISVQETSFGTPIGVLSLEVACT